MPQILVPQIENSHEEEKKLEPMIIKEQKIPIKEESKFVCCLCLEPIDFSNTYNISNLDCSHLAHSNCVLLYFFI